MNDNVQSPPDTRSYRRFFKGRFLYISIGFHLLLAVVATILIVQTFQPRKRTFQAGPKPSNPAPERQYKVKKNTTMSAPPQMKRIASTSASKVNLPELPTITSDSASTSMLSGVGTAAGLGAAPAKMGGETSGGSQLSIFGLRAKANSVVFIIDTSGSMVGARKGVPNWTRLETEVDAGLNSISVGTKFNVVLFAAGTDFFSGAPVPMSPDRKKNAMSFIQRNSPASAIKPGDVPSIGFWRKHRNGKFLGTKPTNALKKAFAWKPDIIIFISDGAPNKDTDPPDKILQMVQDLQKDQPKPVKINAIAYFAGGGQDFMQALASQNGGEFKEISNRKPRGKAARDAAAAQEKEDAAEKELDDAEIGNAQ